MTEYFDKGINLIFQISCCTKLIIPVGQGCFANVGGCLFYPFIRSRDQLCLVVAIYTDVHFSCSFLSLEFYNNVYATLFLFNVIEQVKLSRKSSLLLGKDLQFPG